jgi:DNA-binding MltR family transcriptional regulator
MEDEFIVQQLSKEFENYGDILELLQKESHRGGVLVAGTMLDEYLYKLLKTFMINDAKKVKDLLEGGTNAPLGSFSSRILMSYCLGLISEDEYHDLDTIRKIRNVFAHRLLDASFKDEGVKQLCRNLKACDVVGEAHTLTNAVDRFTITVALLSGRIALRTLQTVRQQRQKAHPFTSLPPVML